MYQQISQQYNPKPPKSFIRSQKKTSTIIRNEEIFDLRKKSFTRVRSSSRARSSRMWQEKSCHEEAFLVEVNEGRGEGGRTLEEG